MGDEHAAGTNRSAMNDNFTVFAGHSLSFFE